MKSLNMIGMAILKDSSSSHAPCFSSSSCFLLFYKPRLKESQTRISVLDQSNIGFRTVNLRSTMTCIMLLFLLLLLLLLLSPVSFSAAAANTNTKTYVVHMKHEARPQSYATHHDWYSSTLQSLTSATSDSLLYAYTTAFQGFAATLSPEEAETLQKSNSVIGIYEDKIYSLHTTRTPQFLGLNDKFSFFDDIDQASTNIIIGVLDTGVWPESKSFDDTGMPAVPARWKGKCESGPGFSPKLCNKKLIGARFFSEGHRGDHKDIESPRDTEGHGTHTASTAAGSPVANASIYGFASGTARGMAPRARVATYKVCWSNGCFESDILAAMDRAILDGVDVLSISIGGDPAPYYSDALAIGAFTAMARGIFVSCSAGNDGPTGGTVSNVAPWIMTVGAGTLDRDFPGRAILGHNNNKELSGASLYGGPRLGDEPVNLVHNRGKNSTSKLCLQGSLEPELVRGKVVVCDRGGSPRVEKGLVVRDAGGVGMILANMRTDGGDLTVDSQLLPTLIVKNKDADMIREYARSDPNSSVTFRFGGTVLNARPAPVVAALSSRGPNTVTPQILKPDVIGPGINVLAAWSGADSPPRLDKDIRRTQFNIQSGTSMSCPHISGIAALVKAAHPNWSPSAIKSALMTSAFVIDNTNSPLQDAANGSPSNPFAHGSGYVDPRKALSPGLIYDISTDEYIAFLCSLDYSIQHVQAIVKRPNITCSKKFNDPGELNYPSFSVVFGNKTVVRYTRELTNVGAARSVYDVDLMAPATVEVIVEPANLVFRNSGDKLRYTATFVSKKAENLSAGSEFGSIAWRNEQHQVRSPIAFTWTHI